MRSLAARNTLALFLSTTLVFSLVPTGAIAEELAREGEATSEVEVPVALLADVATSPEEALTDTEALVTDEDELTEQTAVQDEAPAIRAQMSHVGDRTVYNVDDVVDIEDVSSDGDPIIAYRVVVLAANQDKDEYDVTITHVMLSDRNDDGSKSDYAGGNGTVDLTIPEQLIKEINNDNPPKQATFHITGLSMAQNDAVRSIHIPASVTTIEPFSWGNGTPASGDPEPSMSDVTFGHSHYLEEVTFAAGSPVQDIPAFFFLGSGLTSISLPSGMTTIEHDTFNGSLKLTSVTLPTSLKGIGDFAFYNTSLTSINFPEGLATIGARAFGKGSAYTTDGTYYLPDPDHFLTWAGDAFVPETILLTEVDIPDSVTTIGDGAFAAYNLFPYTSSMQAYTQGDDGTLANEGENRIVTLHLGSGLTSIGAHAFGGTSISKLTLPTSLTSLGAHAFDGSLKLTSVKWSSTNPTQLETFQGFAGCPLLEEVVVPEGVTTLGDDLFANCPNLERVTLPGTLATIGNGAFEGCGKLVTVNIPASVSTIGTGAFANCTSLPAADLPAGVATVGDSAYVGSGISAVNIAATGTNLSLGVGVFSGCTGLNGKTLDFPQRVVSITGNDFYGLKDVTYRFANDHLAIAKPATGGYHTYTGFLPVADKAAYGEFAGSSSSDDTVLVTMPDPWGNQDASVIHTLDVGNSVVYYPATLTKETSPSFWTWKQLMDAEWARHESDAKRGVDRPFVWPQLKTSDEEPPVEPEPQIDPELEKPYADPLGIEDTTGTLSVTTTGPGGTDANLCVFDADNKLVATASAVGDMSVFSDLEAGTYTVVAFAKNPYFTTVGSPSDFAAMGFNKFDYAQSEALVVAKGSSVEAKLTVPKLDTTRLANLATEQSVVLSKQLVPKNTETYALINFQLAAGLSAGTVRVHIPEGVELTSVASTNKNYGTGGYDASTRTLSVTLDARDVAATPCRLWVGLTPKTFGDFGVTATVDVNGIVLPIGNAHFQTKAIVLQVPAEVNARAGEVATTTATVYAEPGKQVTVVAGSETTNLGTTNRNGVCTGTIRLGKPLQALANMKVLVTASITDDDATYTDAQDMRLNITNVQAPSAAIIQEFYFVHAGAKTYLVRNRVPVQQPHYTYMANGDKKKEYWTFGAVYLGSDRLAPTASSQIQMQDGSSRWLDLSLVEQHQLTDGTWQGTYTGVIHIETAGNHVFRADLVPGAFGIWCGYEQKDRTGEPELTQEEHLYLKKRAEQTPAYLKKQAEDNEADVQNLIESYFKLTPDDINTLISGGSAEVEIDLDYVMFHRLTDDERWEVVKKGLIADNHEDIVEVLEAMDQAIVDMTAEVERLYDFKVPASQCESFAEWFERNTGWQHDYEFNEAELEQAGFTIYSNDDGAATTPVIPAQSLLEIVSSSEPTIATPAPSKYAMRVTPSEEDIRKATRDGTELSPHVSVEIADTNGNRMKTGVNTNEMKKLMAQNIIDYDPESGAKTGMNLDMWAWGTTLADYFTNANGNGVALVQVFISDSYGGWGMNFSRRWGYSAQLIGGLASVLSIKGLGETANGYQEGVERQIELDDLVDELEKRWRSYVKDSLGHGYSIDCDHALRDQLFAAIELYNQQKVENETALINYADNSLHMMGEMFVKHPLIGGAILGSHLGHVVILDQAATKNAKTYRDLQIAYLNAERERLEKCKGYRGAMFRTVVSYDPSGVVYEVVPTNPIAGATATVCTWDEATGVATAWPTATAAEYDQVNPQVTGADGRYAWDVPQGDWRVQVQKDGYQNASTGTLPVPPPQLGVDIPLYTTTPPTVQNVTADTQFVEVLFAQYMDTSAPVVVKLNGSAVAVDASMWVSPVEGDGCTADGTAQRGNYARALRVPVPAGTANGDALQVSVSEAMNYASLSMREADVRTVTAAPRPAKIVFDYDTTISLPVGDKRPVTVHLLDKDDNPLKGYKLSAVLDNAYLATLDGAEVVTGEDGTAVFMVDAQLAGLSELTVSVDGTTLAASIDLLTTVDTNQAARPTAKVGGTSVGDGAPAINNITATKGDKLVLDTATEGATIYYTTDGSCPCSNTPARKVYEGPITLTEDVNVKACTYKDGMEFSERLELHITVREPQPGSSQSGNTQGGGSTSSGETQNGSGSKDGNQSGDSTITYYLAAGADQTFVLGSSEGLVFTFKRSAEDETTFSHYRGIEVDGKQVDEDAYTAVKGSVVVTLKPTYLQGLSVGTHTLTASFDDGNSVDAKFAVAQKTEVPATGKSGSSSSSGTSSGSGSSSAAATATRTRATTTPTTADVTPLVLPQVLATVAVALFVLARRLRRTA